MLPEKLKQALDERTGYKALLDEALNERIPGGAKWAYVLGSATLVLFMIQLGTGLVLALYYSPSSTDAWASVAYIEQMIPAGTIVRGIHHHAASGMVVMAVLHMLQVVAFGAYKAPREGNWMSGMALLGLVLAFALTGYLLPWDQTGYWATKVATSIAGTLPVIGGYLQAIAQGGNDYGNLTLTRFYALHVILLPLGTMGLIGVHMYFFRRHGVTPSANVSDVDLTAKAEPFWPKQVLLDTIFALVVVAMILYLAVYVGAPLQAPADPSSNFIARPEWYFLFLFQLLKYFDGPLQIVGTVVIPGAVSTFLLLLPFLDAKPSRRMRDRLPFVGAVAAGLLAIGALTGLALRHDANDPSIAGQKASAAREAARGRELAMQGVPPEGATYMLAHDPLTRGERVFNRECTSCHMFEGSGPKEPEAPDLTGYLSKAWIRQILRDPDSPRAYGLTKAEGMKSFADVPEQDMKQLVDFVYALRQDKLPAVEERPAAGLVEKYECGDCHDFGEYYGVEGPALFRFGTAEWVAKIVDNAEDDALYGEMNNMPIFSKRLAEEDRAALVVFLMSLEARGQKNVWPYVDDAGPVPTPRTKTSSTSK